MIRKEEERGVSIVVARVPITAIGIGDIVIGRGQEVLEGIKITASANITTLVIMKKKNMEVQALWNNQNTIQIEKLMVSVTVMIE